MSLERRAEELKRKHNVDYAVALPRFHVVPYLLYSVFSRLASPPITPHVYEPDNLSAKIEHELDSAKEMYRDMNYLVPIMDTLRDKVVLDVGCGYGGHTIAMAESKSVKSIVGIDIHFDAATLKRIEEFISARRVSNCQILAGTAEDMPVSPESIDVLLAYHVLEHIADVDKFFVECNRVLKPGGMVIAIFPSIKGLMGHHLDSFLNLPLLHYFSSFKNWTECLNYILLKEENRTPYSPMTKVVNAKYASNIQSELNGLDFAKFKEAAAGSGLNVETLELLPLRRTRTSRSVSASCYRTLFSIPFLREVLSNSVGFVARK